MQLKDIFSASSDGVSQPSNSTHRFKQKALAASILAALAIIAFIAVEASDTKPARKAPSGHDHAAPRRHGQGRAHRTL